MSFPDRGVTKRYYTFSQPFNWRDFGDECLSIHGAPRSAIRAGMTERREAPTILAAKQHDALSVFAPANLLREARRQRGLPEERLAAVCALDPDGETSALLTRLDLAGRPGLGTAARG